ncbi:glycosyl hydrolase family 18 protein [Streptosporangium roseum]|uniref:chitinase n=1 Tax=Streptosporangium roseum (strain ATCC 12428 / DSM 43021 / JCM 3005 / KCTC 9067 / NCIMB 10171 / NRRL 2505 / NI 9100) TaxID=479432 RepID=D2BAJ9_STRRD|nr:glycosyl hydrolase family 18 protein [Streptosporangium roseum]ACZ89829.1 Chitinase-like protein [Streptosporangium roseum DSM 43021]
MANQHVLKLLAAVGVMLLPLGAVVATAPGASAAVTVPLRANAGGSALTDAAGDQWVADKAYSSGDWGYQTSYGSGSTGGAIAGTTDDSLYQNYNTFNSWGGYRFDVPNGTYQVTLKMVEDWANAAGQRKFDVRVEGVNALTAFDIFASCGALTACDRTFPATVSDGALNVQFNMNGGANYATVSAISVTGGGGGGDTTPPSVPGNLRSTATSSSSVSLAWNASTDNVGVTGYEIYRGTTLVTTVTGTTHTDTGLTPATAYSYTVRARDAAGNRSTASNQLNVTTQDGGGGGGNKLLGYFTQWGIYQRAYHVKNIVTSGSAAKLTHINYAFGNVQNGQCTLGDTYADYDRFYQAGESVDGVADTWDNGALRGNFNQLRKLKKQFPNIKVLFSFGGWTWSGGFGQAAANPAAFAESCYRLVEDPRWADVFDGIDIDWEYPNACGLTCDTSGFSSFKNLMSALRSRFGSSYLVTAAITADATSGGKIDAADYGGAAQYLDWYNVMTYDFFGAWAAQGPTAPHSPLNTYSGIPITGFDSDSAIQKLKSKGVPASKLLLGIGFYGRGWTGVTQATPGGTATGAAPGTYEAGNEDYKVLKTRCPATGTVAGTAYAHCGNQWWSYDTPATIGGKMSYSKNQGLGGAFFWELTGDTSNGELISAMKSGLG